MSGDVGTYDTATRDGKIELALGEIATGVGGLDNHFLAGNGGRGESEPVQS